MMISFLLCSGLTYGTILDLSRLWRALRSIEELVGLDSKTKGKQ